jgi:hypothetical protein
LHAHDAAVGVDTHVWCAPQVAVVTQSVQPFACALQVCTPPDAHFVWPAEHRSVQVGPSDAESFDASRIDESGGTDVFIASEAVSIVASDGGIVLVVESLPSSPAPVFDPASGVDATPASATSSGAYGGSVVTSTALVPQVPAPASPIPTGRQLSPCGQSSLPAHTDAKTISSSATLSVGTCVCTTRCTMYCPLGPPFRPVTVTNTSWYGLLPATTATVVGS